NLADRTTRRDRGERGPRRWRIGCSQARRDRVLELKIGEGRLGLFGREEDQRAQVGLDFIREPIQVFPYLLATIDLGLAGEVRVVAIEIDPRLRMVGLVRPQ